MAFSGAAIAYATAGGLILYSGIKGATIADTAKAVLAGNLNVTNTEAISSPQNNANVAGAVSDVTVSPSVSQETWIKDLLAALGAPATSANIASITDWMAHEEPSSDWSHWNNPMNTTLRLTGSQSENSVGVQSYPSLSEGLQATVSTLNNGNYGDILLQLRAGNGLRSGAEHGLLTWSGQAYSSV